MKVKKVIQDPNIALVPNFCIPVTLLVPPVFHTFLFNRLEEMGFGLSEYLEYLIGKACKQCRDLPVSHQITTKYQKRGTYPERFNLRISNYLWAELKLLSRSHGYSACQMFIFLMILDCDHCDNATSPQTPQCTYLLYTEFINMKFNKIERHMEIGDILDRKPVGINTLQTRTIRSS